MRRPRGRPSRAAGRRARAGVRGGPLGHRDDRARALGHLLALAVAAEAPPPPGPPIVAGQPAAWEPPPPPADGAAAPASGTAAEQLRAQAPAARAPRRRARVMCARCWEGRTRGFVVMRDAALLLGGAVAGVGLAEGRACFSSSSPVGAMVERCV